MKLKKMFDSIKRCKHLKKDCVIEWKVDFEIDDNSYLFSLLPTIMFQPWPFRYPGCSVIDIMWLNCHIFIGEWNKRKDIDNGRF